MTDRIQGKVRKKASDFDPRILEIFDGYVHGKITKREFVNRAGMFAAAGVTGAMILEQLKPDYALAQQVAPDDPTIETAVVEYESPEGHGTIRGLMAKPAGASGKLPAVLVVHENRGLNPYIEDVARRAAKAGYLAFAPDGLSPLGGYPGTDDEGREMQRQPRLGKADGRFFSRPSNFSAIMPIQPAGSAASVSATVVAFATPWPSPIRISPHRSPSTAASRPPRTWPAIQAPLLIQYAGLDDRINAGWEAYSAALREHQKEFSVHFYPGVNHGFHNDTTPPLRRRRGVPCLGPDDCLFLISI